MKKDIRQKTLSLIRVLNLAILALMLCPLCSFLGESISTFDLAISELGNTELTLAIISTMFAAVSPIFLKKVLVASMCSGFSAICMILVRIDYGDIFEFEIAFYAMLLLSVLAATAIKWFPSILEAEEQDDEAVQESTAYVTMANSSCTNQAQPPISVNAAVNVKPEDANPNISDENK